MALVDDIRSVRFREEREDDMRRLETLVSKAERVGLRNMAFDEVTDLTALYRLATSSLAIAREISLDRSLIDYLEALAARAYLTVYAPQDPVGGLFRRFFTRSGPAAIRRSWLCILIAFLTLGSGFAAGFFLYFENPAWYYVFTSSGMADGRGPDASTSYLRSVIFDENPTTDGLASFATFLFSHNTRIAIFAFGLGVFLCAPALALLFYNGLSIGALYALYVERGLGSELGGWLSIHGVTEISAICIAGGAGIKLGLSVLFPGNLSRSRSLFQAGKDATKLALIAALMLIAAALIEGFARQLVQDTVARYTIGWTIGLFWLSWFIFAGARRK